MIKPINPQAQSIVDEINATTDIENSIHELAEQALIPQGIEIPKPEVVFGMDDIPVFTKKSISTLIGRAKSGKTTCSAWVMAQTIQKQLLVLWIDTEQGQYYASRTQSWVLKIAQILTSDYLKFYDLKIHNPTIRVQIIQLLIEELTPDIVVIDGIRDLVFDINNAEEATIITGSLMRWADLFNCHILSIIHQNKGNEHARGHLGTEMINKSETVIKVSRDEKNITICEPEFTRGEAFPIFAFDRDVYGLPVIINYQAKINGGESNAKKTLPIDIGEETHIECLKKSFGSDIKLSYSELLPAISASFEYFGMAMGVVKAKSFIQFYNQNGYLAKAEKTGSKTFYILIDRPKKSKFINHYEAQKDEDYPF